MHIFLRPGYTIIVVDKQTLNFKREMLVMLIYKSPVILSIGSIARAKNGDY